jgi:hypothetical protein
MIDLAIRKPHLFKIDSELLDSDKNKFSNFINAFLPVLQEVGFCSTLCEPITYEKVELMRLRIEEYLESMRIKEISTQSQLQNAIFLLNSKNKEQNK